MANNPVGNIEHNKIIDIEDPLFSISDVGHLPERPLPKTPSTNPSELREEICSWLIRDLFGPLPSDEHQIEYLIHPPSSIYSAGILFPQQLTAEQTEDSIEDSSEWNEDEGLNAETSTPKNIGETSYNGDLKDDTIGDDELTLANSYRQSAIGISFRLSGEIESFEVTPHASKYQSVNLNKVNGNAFTQSFGKSRYMRSPIHLDPVVISLGESNQDGFSIKEKLSEGLYLRVKARRPSNGVRTITVSMVNERLLNDGARPEFSHNFYQCSLAIHLKNGASFSNIEQSRDTSSVDFDEEQLKLLYRDRKSYAFGHGCATEWDDSQKTVTCLSTTAIPKLKVPPVVPRTDGNKPEYSMTALSSLSEQTDKDVIALLTKIPRAYREWIDSKSGEAAGLDHALSKTAKINLEKCENACTRIEAGIELLKSNKQAMLAFRLCNRAMVSQQIHFSQPLKAVDDPWTDIDECYENLKPNQGKWRVFQLAFLLSNVTGGHRSLDATEREHVDLIWFPTGGGKTEAYLGLSAFCIFFRRLLDPQDAGCTVLMRYTLRLLTVQQFQRAASLICACEMIRRENESSLGKTPISIGMWVGGDLTPNDQTTAKKALSDFTKNKGENKFQLTKCPWCGTELDGSSSKIRNAGKLGYKKTKSGVVISCPSTSCDFSQRSFNVLPVHVVDDDIYNHPPTLIIGTVDKFAMLAWNEPSGGIFGKGSGFSPPELIIQDELHLISGPVGTMVGLYESAIDLLCEDEHGVGAKIIGSTATIRRASEQVRSLYNRDINQFPPPGISASDNYFSFEKSHDPGRVYIGFCPLSASSFVTGIVRCEAAILQAAKALEITAETEDAEDHIRDGYWTLIQYYNSLRELGRGVTLLQQDIPEWINSRSRSLGIERRYINNVEELTSRKKGEEIPKILEGLDTSITTNGAKNRGVFDSVLATNMISVGVDVDRLGVMTIMGQPKTTSEYIQASSRVGRKDHPGLVVTCYNPAKPRDRSHYETFFRYHNALYKWVEPTSVTPFSIPAVEKGLHGVLIILLRHKLGFSNIEDVQLDDPRIDQLIETITRRCISITGSIHGEERGEEISSNMRKLIELICSGRKTKWGTLKTPDDDQLMIANKDRELVSQAYVTPTSLRGVDEECELSIEEPKQLFEVGN